MDAFVGTVLAVAFNYAPRGWSLCNGQLLSISQNAAVFSLLGTTYGGDGVNTFGLPDLRGRTILGQGTGLGLQPIIMGERAGTNNVTVNATGNVSVTISAANLPSHTHAVSIPGTAFGVTSVLNATSLGPATPASSGTAPTANATLCNSGAGGTAGAVYLPTTGAATNLVPLNTASVATSITGTANVTSGPTGTGTAITAPVNTTSTVSIMPPYLGMNYIICMVGIYPSRN